jgi:hypothetical protein
MTSIAAVLLACLAIGSLLVYWHAIAKVETELRGALAVGARTVRNAIADGRAERLPRELLRIAGDEFQRAPPFARIVDR